MGVITRYFKCENEKCKTKPEWNNTDHQLENQLCKDCNKVTKYFKFKCEGMLYGKYQCKGKCTNEWTSAAAVDGSWQMCLKCKKKATPYYLREHDRREDEIEKEEEGKATQRKDKVHIQAHCGECLRLATEKKFMETCLEYWAMKADPEKEAKAQKQADKKRPMIKAEMQKKQKIHVEYVESFTRDNQLDSSRVEDNNNENNDDKKKTEQAKKKNKRKPKKKITKKAEVKTEPLESKTVDKTHESHVDFVKAFTEKAEHESSGADKKMADDQNNEKPKKKHKRKPKKKQTKKADVKTEPVEDQSAGGPKVEQNKTVVKKESIVEVKTEDQADQAPQKKDKKTKKSKNSGSSSPNQADNNNFSEVKVQDAAVGEKNSKKKRNRNKRKKASGENKENNSVSSENTSTDDLVHKIADMDISSPQKATRTSTTSRRVLTPAGDAE